jgi:aryl-alcohol dehydrogenase-like predicted oxidoreductase
LRRATGISMKQRRLGRKGPMISAIGLGCMGMSGGYGAGEDAESVATIHRALDLGVNFLDTADSYNNGHNEGLVGRAIHDRRERVFLASKFGRGIGDEAVHRQIFGKPEYVRNACEASLRRLGVDVIDLYYQHRIDPTVPIEETVGAMAELVTAGKVRYLGICEAPPEQIRRAHRVHPIAALESEYSLFSRSNIEDNGVLSTIRELGITLVPYSPLGRGMLTGTIRSFEQIGAGDARKKHPRFQPENLVKNLAVVEALGALAREVHATTPQLALAWLLAQGPDIIPIPGTKRVANLLQNAAAVDITITPPQWARLAAIAPKGVAAGRRDSPNSMVST